MNAAPHNSPSFFEDRYQILGELGRGGFGEVWKARQRSTGQLVAIKMLNMGTVDTQQRADRLQRLLEKEMKLIARLDSPHVVRLYDSGVTPAGDPFMVLELVKGVTLRQFVQQGAMVPEAAVRIMLQVLEAVADAHDLGIVHCDLKPENIMVSVRSQRLSAKILDFGVAALTEDGRGHVDESEDQTHGTPHYMPPELLGGLANAVPASDVYALGLILGEMLTGQKMVSGESIERVLAMQLATPVEIPEELGWSEIGSLIERATAKDVGERYPDAAAMLTAMEEIDVNLVPLLDNTLSVEELAGFADAEALFDGLEAISEDLEAVPMTALTPAAPLLPIKSAPPAGFPSSTGGTPPASGPLFAPHATSGAALKPAPRESGGSRRLAWVVLFALALVSVVVLIAAVTRRAPTRAAPTASGETGSGQEQDETTPDQTPIEPETFGPTAERPDNILPLAPDELPIDDVLGRARTAARDGDAETAIALYQDAIEEHPDDHKAREELGWLLLSLNRFKDALIQFKTLAEDGLQSETVTLALALAYEGLGESSAARNAFEKFLKLYPDSKRRDTVQERLSELPASAPATDTAETTAEAKEQPQRRRRRRRSRAKRPDLFE